MKNYPTDIKYAVVDMAGDVLFEGALAEALHNGVAHVAKTNECVVVDPSGGAPSIYRLEPDTKVDDDDLTFPVIVHTDAILVGVDA